MAKKNKDEGGLSLPIAMMFFCSLAGGIIVGLCFEVIKYWPQPVSAWPYFGWDTAIWWGFIVGGVNGLVLGFLTDDKNFEKASYER